MGNRNSIEGYKFSTVYKKEKKSLAKGGQGEVYRCIDKNLKDVCAVKIIKINAISSDDLERFELEAKTLKNLPQHPNVVRFINHFREPKKHYLVMDFASGGDLSNLI